MRARMAQRNECGIGLDFCSLSELKLLPRGAVHELQGLINECEP